MRIKLSEIINNCSNAGSEPASTSLDKSKVRQHKICDGCFICDEDLVLAMQKMTAASIRWILDQGNIILKSKGI